jgi:hypothetical protein
MAIVPQKLSYRYSPDYRNSTRQPKNWVNLTRNCRIYSERDKILHIDTILSKTEEKRSENTPGFLSLMYLLRRRAIILAYFTPESRYYLMFSDYSTHPGWKDLSASPEELRILYMLKKAVTDLEKDRKNTTAFDQADREFGSYRHRRWMSSKSCETA